MSQRVLKQLLFDAPQLARLYVVHTLKVYNHKAFVHPNSYPKFRTFEEDLSDEYISLKHYTITVLEMLRRWVTGKNLNCVPVSVFCGDWALSKYRKICDTGTVDITVPTAHSEILLAELYVARAYITANLQDVVRMSDIVSNLNPLLPKEWVELYNQHKRMRLVNEALIILSKEFRVHSPTNYNDIVRALL